MSSYNRRIQLRRDSLENFTTHGPVLASGEPAIAFRPTRNDNTNSIDQPLLKIGNNGSQFVNLPQFLTNNDVDVFKYEIDYQNNITADSSITVTLAEKTNTFLNNSDEYAVFVAPAEALPENLDILYGYYDATSSGSEITVVLHNHGSAEIFPFTVDVYVMVAQAVQNENIVTTTPPPANPLSHKEMFLAGRNMHGQLGLGDNKDKTKLTRLYPYVETFWEQADSGYDHTVALSSLNELYVAGSNYYGQLGTSQPTNIKRNTFVQVSDVYAEDGIYESNSTFNKVSAGSFHTAAINNSGELFVCGNNAYGGLGIGSTANSNKLRLVNVDHVGTDDRKYRALALNADITHDNGKIQLVDASEEYSGPKGYIIEDAGTYTINSPTYPVAFISQDLNNCLETPETLTYTGAVAHSTNTIDGDSYTFYTGQITIDYNGCPLPSTGVKIAIKDGSEIIEDQFLFDHNLNGGWTDVSCGQYHTIGVKNKKLWGWGHNYFGQTGHSPATLPRSITPLQVQTVGDTLEINRVVAGEYHSLILESAEGDTDGGQAWAIGLNDRGQLGYGDLTNRSGFIEISREALAVPLVGSLDIIEAAAGKKHTLLVSNDNKLYIVGDNTYGQLGINRNYITVPESTMSSAMKVAAGSNHSVVLDTFNRLQTVGLNSHGQLGLTDTENRSSFSILNDQESYLTTDEDTYRFEKPAAGGNNTIAFRFDYLPTAITSITRQQTVDYRENPTNEAIVQDLIEINWNHPGLEEAVETYRFVFWKKISEAGYPTTPIVTSEGIVDNGYESVRVQQGSNPLRTMIRYTPSVLQLNEGAFGPAVFYLDQPATVGINEYIVYIYGVNNIGDGTPLRLTITVEKTAT